MTADHAAWLEALTIRERTKGTKFIDDYAAQIRAELGILPKVCGNRTDSPGFFTPCFRCVCAAEVRDDLEHDPYAYAGDDVVEPLITGHMEVAS